MASFSFGGGGGQALPTCAFSSCNKEVYYDYRTNTAHDYCGRTCAKKNGEQLDQPHGNCHQCKLQGCSETVAFDEQNDRAHDFCGYSHYEAAVQSGQWKVADRRPRKKHKHRSSSSSSSGGSGSTCKLFGCSAPVWTDNTNNQEYDYCSRTHANRAAERGELPPSDTGYARSFSGNSGSGMGDWSLNLLKSSHPKYANVRDQFLNQWAKADPAQSAVQVVRIYQIKNPQQVYNSFLHCVEQRGENTVVRRFHGTGVECQVGVDPNAGPCDSATCPLCNICRVGFSLDFVNRRVGGPLGAWLRYGPGLYFSKCSGKSNDYNSTSVVQKGPRGAQSVPHRSMFLCKVALGRNRIEYEDDMGLTKIILNGQGFDSISGKVGQQGSLNFPEDVVFDSCAAIPSYMIVYSIY